MAVYKKLVTLIAKVIVIFIITTTSTAIWKKSINSQATYTREGIEQKIFFLVLAFSRARSQNYSRQVGGAIRVSI